jgi:two-component system, response regulator PdtaR
MRVLVVDDESMVRRLIADNLADAGYSVIEATDADDAIAQLSVDDAVDLVVTDVRMPGSLDGLALSNWVKARRPSIKVLVVSGFANEAANAVRSYDAFLNKPFTSAALRRNISNLIGLPAGVSS